MKELHRQLVQQQRRLAAGLRAADIPAARDERAEPAGCLRRGVARIADNDGGEYSITEQWWDPATQEWSDATSPLGLVEEPARDFAGSDLGLVGQLVRFWQQRALGGEVQTFIDAGGGGTGLHRTSSFCVHYSGVNDQTPAFHSIGGCKNAKIEICVSVHLCSGNGYDEDHPGSNELELYHFASPNRFWSWGGDMLNAWIQLTYVAVDAAGNVLGENSNPIADFFVEYRLGTGGSLEFRVNNDRTGEPNTVSAVIAGTVSIIHHAAPPGAKEIGNCCCHEDDPGVWGDGYWGVP